MQAFPIRLHTIARQDFNHGLTRDQGAAQTTGAVIVFLNQDAIPAHPHWLEQLTAPLFADPQLAAVQGAMAEVPDRSQWFFWHSCGERFYFTSESRQWIAAHGGIGFSTVNAALRRSVWQAHPFGPAPIMEDKKWQQAITAAGFMIAYAPEGLVYHTHNYHWRSLKRRCISEGYGWRLLGVRYGLGQLWQDMRQAPVYQEWWRGLRSGEIRTAAAFCFPWARPWWLYWGNRWARSVRL